MEKIALQKQKQAEGTAEFEKIMKEVYATKMDESHSNQRIIECSFISDGPRCSVGTATESRGRSPSSVVECSAGGGGSGSTPTTPTTYRERGRSMGVGPMRRPSDRKVDRSPYGSGGSGSGGSNSGGSSANNNNNGGTIVPAQNIAYLSPPIDTNWRRSNSDSAIHQSLNIATGSGSVGATGGSGNLSVDLSGHHANQRSHSPNIISTVGLSPAAQRRKFAHGGSMGNFLQQPQQHQQQQQQQQHLQFQQQHNMQLDVQHHQVYHQQQQQQFVTAPTPKFYNLSPTNSLLKTLQDQANVANTGSLPDLTSVHFGMPQQPQHQQQQEQQQQQHLSPVLSPHNAQTTERDQSQSPFSPHRDGSPYPSQQHSPTMSPQQQQQQQQLNSPHLSFNNLSVQQSMQNSNGGDNGAQVINIPNVNISNPNSNISNSLHSSYGHLPSIGVSNASSTGNLTDYRSPMNPPSPGSSPGLLASVSGGDLHSSAPNSPIRHQHQSSPHHMHQNQQHQQQQQQHQQHHHHHHQHNQNFQQTFDRFSPIDGYNSLNSSFHNHFEQFSLGDSNSSVAVAAAVHQQIQQYQHQPSSSPSSQTTSQANNFGLVFESMFSTGGSDDNSSSHGNGGGDGGGNGDACEHPSYSQQQQRLSESKLIDFSELSAISGSLDRRSNSIGSGNNLGLNPNSKCTSSSNSSNHASNKQNGCNNNRSNEGGDCRTLRNNNNNRGRANVCNSSSNRNRNNRENNNQNNNSSLVNDAGATKIATTTTTTATNMRQTLSGSRHNSPLPTSAGGTANPSMSSSTSSSPSSSPSAVPMSAAQSPHPTMSLSRCSTHSPTNSVVTSLPSPTSASAAGIVISSASSAQSPSTATSNIPSIIFSDYSSNSDFSREIFDTLDLDLGQMDVAGLQMLSDPNTIMIADPTIEDSFRRDLN